MRAPGKRYNAASRTEWADWCERPVLCSECGRPVTLKQAHRGSARTRSVWHVACDPFAVRLVVEARS
jgi:hypothetical protein